MSMHLRNSRDMMNYEEKEGWWSSKTGLEQKLIIFSSFLFLLSFCLAITVIVLDHRVKAANSGGGTTAAVTGSTSEQPLTVSGISTPTTSVKVVTEVSETTTATKIEGETTLETFTSSEGSTPPEPDSGDNNKEDPGKEKPSEK